MTRFHRYITWFQITVSTAAFKCCFCLYEAPCLFFFFCGIFFSLTLIQEPNPAKCLVLYNFESKALCHCITGGKWLLQKKFMLWVESSTKEQRRKQFEKYTRSSVWMCRKRRDKLHNNTETLKIMIISILFWLSISQKIITHHCWQKQLNWRNL